ncbi:MAG TPA: hypothetical protein DCM87_00420, partial [Planctomycetes bacterium]|nr:hypothetical protein [Planctomycetota bacterium]
CDSALGAPPTPNVMVIGGNSIPGSAFDGVLAEREGDGGCCAEALAGEGRACNKPAEITYSPGSKFRPGNANGDGKLDLADGIFILGWLYRGGRDPGCVAALDVNLDGVVDSSDAIMIIYWQFLEGPAPEQGLECGTFKTDLPCDVQEQC